MIQRQLFLPDPGQVQTMCGCAQQLGGLTHVRRFTRTCACGVGGWVGGGRVGGGRTCVGVY